MTRSDSPQLELFMDTQSSSGGVSTKRHFLSYIFAYEKAILFIMGLILASIVSFTLGVEKGKGMGRLGAVAQPVQEQKIQQIKMNPVAPQPSLRQTVPLSIPKGNTIRQEPQGQGPAWTVQIASYKARNLAEKEAQVLKKGGFSTLVFNKGAYTVLCVGNFNNKQTAQSLLSQLQRRYKDCLIRRL